MSWSKWIWPAAPRALGAAVVAVVIAVSGLVVAGGGSARADDPPEGTVVLDEDFSSVPDGSLPAGWTASSGTWAVQGGRLVGEAGGGGPGGNAVITFGQHLDNFRFDATLQFTADNNDTSRWQALALDIPGTGTPTPWMQATTRVATDGSSGLEFCEYSPADGYTDYTRGMAPTAIGLNQDVQVSIVVEGTHGEWWFNGQKVFSTDDLYRTDDGVQGLIVNGATVSYSHVTLTELPAPPPPPDPALLGFPTSQWQLPQVPVGDTVNQPLAGLWGETTPTSFSEVDGDVPNSDWLSVSPDGVVSGTPPAGDAESTGVITVQATDGTATQTLEVDVPVIAAREHPQITAASWNLQDAATDAKTLRQELTAVTGVHVDVLGLQGTGGISAQELADALGWHAYQSSGDLGIVSAYPISDVIEPTDTTPAAGATVTIDGRPVRVWVTHLDESSYGPDLAAQPGATAASLIASEQASTRYAEAEAVAAEMRGDVAADGTDPVLLLGDLASPSAQEWTAATADAHDGIAAVDWPVPDVFSAAGLSDSFAQANPDPTAYAGDTYPLDGPSGPTDRVDYVDYAGGLQVIDSEADYPWDVTAWPSDHAAMVTDLTVLGDTVAPVVRATVSPARPNGRQGWYTTAPTISASATDNVTAGPAIEYSTDGGSTWTPYAGPLTAAEGTDTYEFRATDDNANTSDPVSVAVTVDTTAPVTQASARAAHWPHAPERIVLTATDASSGIARTQYRLASERWLTYRAPITVARRPFPTRIEYRSIDRAGNVEQIHTAWVAVGHAHGPH